MALNLTDPTPLEAGKSGLILSLLNLLKNPMNAIIFAAAWLLYVMGNQVVAAQKEIAMILVQHQRDTDTLRADATNGSIERRAQIVILRQICLSVTKGDAQVRCGDDR